MLQCRPLSGRTVCRLARPRHGGTGTTPVALSGPQPVSVVKALRDRMQLQVAGGTHAGSNSAGAVPRPMPRCHPSLGPGITKLAGLTGRIRDFAG